MTTNVLYNSTNTFCIKYTCPECKNVIYSDHEIPNVCQTCKVKMRTNWIVNKFNGHVNSSKHGN